MHSCFDKKRRKYLKRSSTLLKYMQQRTYTLITGLKSVKIRLKSLGSSTTTTYRGRDFFLTLDLHSTLLLLLLLRRTFGGILTNTCKQSQEAHTTLYSCGYLANFIHVWIFISKELVLVPNLQELFY